MGKKLNSVQVKCVDCWESEKHVWIMCLRGRCFMLTFGFPENIKVSRNDVGFSYITFIETGCLRRVVRNKDV